jgi:LuxR family transcriptional regulator, quorum-sensing system regulator BjaR1
MDVASLALEFFERCQEYRDPQSVLDGLAAHARQVGFEHFIFTGLPAPAERAEALVLLNGWPPEWFERYATRNYFALDGVSQWTLRTTRPFAWGEVPAELSSSHGSQRIKAEARAFNLRDGFVVPLYSAHHWQSAVSFASSHECDLSARERGALIMMGTFADMSVRRIVGERPRPAKLSRREREILGWASRGKSAWETSSILSISENTVIEHLREVRRKLDVATTIQAVAEGIRRGEIDP